jgi:hypothetical protein
VFLRDLSKKCSNLCAPTVLYHNAIGMNFIAFLDSGANGFYFIFIPKVIILSNILNTFALRLSQQVPVKEYNNKRGTTIIYYLVLYCIIDR